MYLLLLLFVGHSLNAVPASANGLLKCKASAGGRYLGACSDDCHGPDECPSGEHCCFNGYCKKCETMDCSQPTSRCPNNPCDGATCQGFPGAWCEPDYCTCEAKFRYRGLIVDCEIPQCAAYNEYGPQCENKCTGNGGCGYLESCCFNGKCNKCELNEDVGPGLPQCENSPPQWAYPGCTDDCTLPSDCGRHQSCCFNGFCKKCEQKGVPECTDLSPSARHGYHCYDECSLYQSCPRGKECCTYNGCHICVAVAYIG